jgi:uncharacterized protein
MDKGRAAKRGARLAALAVVTSAVVLGATACASTPSHAADPSPSCGGSGPKLTVQGTGLATGTPNLLTAQVGISVTDGSATAALADDDNRAATVTGLLTKGGVAPADVQTSDVSISPQYDDHGDITGYQVSNTLTAKLRNFADAGSLIDAIAGAAGNAIRLDSLTFSVEDTRALEDQARSDAVHQGVSHAQSMALAAGERLGPVCSLTDNSQTNSYQPYQFGLGQASAAGPDNAAALPLEPGSQQESDQVTMVYELLPPRPGR